MLIFGFRIFLHERLLLGGVDNCQPSEDFIRGWLESLCPLRDGQIWEWVIWMGSGRYGWSGGYRWRWGVGMVDMDEVGDMAEVLNWRIGLEKGLL